MQENAKKVCITIAHINFRFIYMHILTLYVRPGIFVKCSNFASVFNLILSLTYPQNLAEHTCTTSIGVKF